MSAYRDFTSDFPSRCLDILDNQMAWAKFRGRDVTLLLMVASSAFLVPYERLRPDNQRPPHPSGDNKRFAELSLKLEILFREKFIGSQLCTSLENSWKYATDVKRIDGDIDTWFLPASLRPVTKEKQISAMLVWIRNALAHGNIYTSGNPIDKLILVQLDEPNNVKNSTCHVLSVNPEDFGRFVRGWIGFVGQSDVQELLRAA